MLTLDLHDVATGQFLTQLTPPWMAGVPGAVSFDAADRVATAWSLHSLARQTPSAVSLHALPLGRDEALAAVQATLAAGQARAPDGSLRTPEQPNSN
jgi:hypothetical protein